jgi:hypothetical protein
LYYSSSGSVIVPLAPDINNDNEEVASNADGAEIEEDVCGAVEKYGAYDASEPVPIVPDAPRSLSDPVYYDEDSDSESEYSSDDGSDGGNDSSVEIDNMDVDKLMVDNID